MAKKVLELDTPFRTGERILTTRDLRGVSEGAPGKIRLANGLSDSGGGKAWMRYWVRFEDGSLLGQIDHNDLVRPAQVLDWQQRKADQDEQVSELTVEDTSSKETGGADGAAALIPAALLERSKAAKARLLGG